MQPTTRRAAEVARVLARHGLGSLVEFLEVHAPRRLRRASRVDASPRVGPVRRGGALEELGPTFVRLGQVLSPRPDLVPPKYETELARLQDSAPWVPAARIVDLVE